MNLNRYQDFTAISYNIYLREQLVTRYSAELFRDRMSKLETLIDLLYEFVIDNFDPKLNNDQLDRYFIIYVFGCFFRNSELGGTNPNGQYGIPEEFNYRAVVNMISSMTGIIDWKVETCLANAESAAKFFTYWPRLENVKSKGDFLRTLIEKKIMPVAQRLLY